MKEVDDTPVGESECEQCGAVIPRGYEDAACWPCVLKWEIEHRKTQERDNRRLIAAMELRLANLEARKPPQDTNQDPEWY